VSITRERECLSLGRGRVYHQDGGALSLEREGVLPVKGKLYHEDGGGACPSLESGSIA
jgi:hypothetical protein